MPARSTVVISGAARGQGAEHTRYLATRGYRVIITDVLDELSSDLAHELQAVGLDVAYRHLDVGNEDQWVELADELHSANEQLVALVNNAGILRYGRIPDVSMDDWVLQERINVHGTLYGIRQLAPLMSAAGGSVVNVSSTAALRGSAGYAAYAASKAAVLALTRVAAVEYAPKIRVNVICPGGVSTPMNNDEPPGGTSTGTPLGRRARPGEISPLIAYLISDSASFVTGSMITIDGGLTAA